MNVNILADLSSQILSWDELERRGSAQHACAMSYNQWRKLCSAYKGGGKIKYDP